MILLLILGFFLIAIIMIAFGLWMLPITFGVIVLLGVCCLVKSFLGNFLIFYVYYIFPSTLILILILFFLDRKRQQPFHLKRYAKGIGILLLAEVLMYQIWTHLPVSTNFASDAFYATIVTTKQYEGIKLSHEKTKDLITYILDADLQHSFRQYFDEAKIAYKTTLYDENDQIIAVIYSYDDDHIIIERSWKLYYASDSLYSKIRSLYLDEMRTITIQECTNTYETQIRELKNSVCYHDGIIQFTIPENLPENYELSIYGVVANKDGRTGKLTVQLREDFLKDITDCLGWKENTTYEFDVSHHIFKSLALYLRLNGTTITISILDCLPLEMVLENVS